MKANRPIKAIIRKEFSGHFYSLTAYIFIVVFLVAIMFLFFDQFFLIKQTSMRVFFSLVPWFMMFLIPALSMRIWSEEKKYGTDESLLTLPISDLQIVVAKFFGSFLFIGVLLLFSLTLPITLSKIGDLDWGPVIGAYLGAWLLGGAYLSLGQYISALTKNMIVAYLVTIAAAFIFLILGFPFVLQKTGELSAVFYTLSTITHFENMSKGVIDLRDIVYYISFISIFLYLNLYSITRRYWK